MRDIVNRKAVSDLVKNRLNKVLAGVGSADDIKDPFDRGKATAYENVLYDISARLPTTESEGEIESLKAITKLAVKALEEEMESATIWGQHGTVTHIKSVLEEINRLKEGEQT